MAKGTMNTIVTNIHGPQLPLYLLGARMREMIPLPPLLENIGLAIGVLSFDGQVFWGYSQVRVQDHQDVATCLGKSKPDCIPLSDACLLKYSLTTVNRA